MEKYTRLSVNLNRETATALRELSERRETSITEIVRRAVAVYKLVDDAMSRGGEVQLVDDKGSKRTLALLTSGV